MCIASGHHLLLRICTSIKKLGCNCPVFGILCCILFLLYQQQLGSTTTSGHLKCNENIQAALKTPHVIIIWDSLFLMSQQLIIPDPSFLIRKHLSPPFWRNCLLFRLKDSHHLLWICKSVNKYWQQLPSLRRPLLHSFSSLPRLLIANSLSSTPTCETVGLRLWNFTGC